MILHISKTDANKFFPKGILQMRETFTNEVTYRSIFAILQRGRNPLRIMIIIMKVQSIMEACIKVVNQYYVNHKIKKIDSSFNYAMKKM